MDSTQTPSPAEADGESPQRHRDPDSHAVTLLQANKTALFDALAAAGLTSVIVTFDGYGDSGQIERVEAQAGEQPTELPSTTLTLFRPGAAPDAVTFQDLAIEAAIEGLVYDLLEVKSRGWENDCGAYGDFTFDVAARTISLDFNERYEASINSSFAY